MQSFGSKPPPFHSQHLLDFPAVEPWTSPAVETASAQLQRLQLKPKGPAPPHQQTTNPASPSANGFSSPGDMPETPRPDVIRYVFASNQWSSVPQATTPGMPGFTSPPVSGSDLSADRTSSWP